MKPQRTEATTGFYKDLGARIARARRDIGMSQETLAQKANLTRTSIVNIEKGRQQVFLHTVVELSKSLAIAIDSLIPEIDDLDSRLANESEKGRDWIMMVAKQLTEKGAESGSS